jgi:hypothetical protein
MNKRIALHVHIAAYTTLVSLCFIAAFAVPSAISAQSSDDELRASIQAALEAGVWADGVTPEEMQALVDQLVAKAQQDGLTAEDVKETINGPFVYSGDATAGGDRGFLEGETSATDTSTSAIALAFLVGAGIVLALLYALWRRVERSSVSI